MSSVTHFSLKPGCEDYSFLDQAVTNFEQGLDSILTDSVETPELETSLDEPDAFTSSVSSGSLHLVSTISDTSKLQLVPSIRSHKLWCQSRTLLAPVPLSTKMSASKLIHYFSSHPAGFGFWSSTPPDNMTLTPANRKADQNFRLALVLCLMPLLTLSSSFLASELTLLILFPRPDLLTKVHHILNNAVSK